MIGDVILNVLHSVTSLCRNHDVTWSPRYDHIRLLTQASPPPIMPRASTTRNQRKAHIKKGGVASSEFL